MIKLGEKQLGKLGTLIGKGWVPLENTPFEIRVEANYPIGYFDIRWNDFSTVNRGRIWQDHDRDCRCLTCLDANE